MNQELYCQKHFSIVVREKCISIRLSRKPDIIDYIKAKAFSNWYCNHPLAFRRTLRIEMNNMLERISFR